MNWHHILEKQPEDKTIIIKIEKPYTDGNEFLRYLMGIQEYNTHGVTMKQTLQWRAENNLPLLNWWWMDAKDFPWPKEPNV